MWVEGRKDYESIASGVQQSCSFQSHLWKVTCSLFRIRADKSETKWLFMKTILMPAVAHFSFSDHCLPEISLIKPLNYFVTSFIIEFNLLKIYFLFIVAI